MYSGLLFIAGRVKDHIMHGASHADPCSQSLHKCFYRVRHINRRQAQVADTVPHKESVNYGIHTRQCHRQHGRDDKL